MMQNGFIMGDWGMFAQLIACLTPLNEFVKVSEADQIKISKAQTGVTAAVFLAYRQITFLGEQVDHYGTRVDNHIDVRVL